MKDDIRGPFDASLDLFVDFLSSQEISTELLWLSRDRLSRYRRTWWVYRPYELISSASSREFYESLRETSSSIRIDGYPFTSDVTFAWVEDYGGPSKLLNFGLLTSKYEIRVVKNRYFWLFIRLCNLLRDLRYRSFSRNITPRTEQVSGGNQIRA